MTSPGVVEALDIVQNIGFGMGFGEIDGAVHTLVFQCGEERFGQAIDAPIVCDCLLRLTAALKSHGNSLRQ